MHDKLQMSEVAQKGREMHLYNVVALGVRVLSSEEPGRAPQKDVYIRCRDPERTHTVLDLDARFYQPPL